MNTTTAKHRDPGRRDAVPAARHSSPEAASFRADAHARFGHSLSNLAIEADAPIQRREDPAAQTGLPDALRSGVESLSGVSMDDVRVHANSSQPAHLNALAYAQGSNIHLGPGEEQHLPHEAWHVAQQ